MAAAASDRPETGYALLDMTTVMFEEALALDLPVKYRTAQGAKKLRVGFECDDVARALPSAEQLKAAVSSVNARIKQGGQLSPAHDWAVHDVGLIKELKLSTTNDRRATKKEYEVLLNITGALPKGPAPKHEAKGAGLAAKGLSQADMLKSMPVLNKDNIHSAVQCLLFEIDCVLQHPPTSFALSSSSSSSSSSSAASSSSSAASSSAATATALSPAQRQVLSEKMAAVLLQFKNNSYASGFLAASK